MAKINVYNALPGSQFNDNSINNTVVINHDMEDQPLENQPIEQSASGLEINEKERAIRDFVRVINALAEAEPKFFIKNGKKAHQSQFRDFWRCAYYV